MRTFIATTGDGIEIARDMDGTWRVEKRLEGVRVNCVATSSAPGGRWLLGTAGSGILASSDHGETWTPSGLVGQNVKAVAISVARPTLVVAGTKPAALHISDDAGETWRESEAFRRIPWRRTWFSPAEWPPVGYVQAIALSSTEPNVMNVGIETGGVMHSSDGGATWTRARGAIYDCHALAAHPSDGSRFYQGGAGLGRAAAVSSDGGKTWLKFQSGSKLNYGWAVCADPDDPDGCHYSSAVGPTKAHGVGRADAVVFRAASGTVVPASHAFTDMPYALIPTGEGGLVAGLSSGEVWERTGDTWQRMPFRFSGIHRCMVAAPD